MLKDHAARSEATNPEQSFIVQAPAGSGKTELLTQRFLRLLANVEAPEQIIALTFTRKAANEMRERILKALAMANSGFSAESAHLKQTLTYAEEALKRNKAKNWNLLQQPGRLHIYTIDALCQRLNQAIPLQEKQIAYAKVAEKPQKYYRAAAEDCLNYAIRHEEFQPAIKLLLKHVDNHQETLLSLLSDLLAKRDNWLAMIADARLQKKEDFEKALSFIEEHELARLHLTLPEELAQDLVNLVRKLADIESDPASPRHTLRNLSHFRELNRELSASLAATLLTSEMNLRKSFDHHVGLKRGICPDKEYNELKEQSRKLLEQLGDYPDFCDCLVQAKELPVPVYDVQQWQVLQAIFKILPLLAASLQLVFSKHNTLDFTAVSEQALHALGDEDNPTDLTLYLDHQIHHLLVDEFQDTSIRQFKLLEKLIGGWEPHSGKTLFLVGDPMQSIYRFRSAEVGLFLRAKEQGIGPVKLVSLQLNSNFRSTATIVDWVNRHFKNLFPSTDDIESGAVSYHDSTSIHPQSKDSFITACALRDAEEEAFELVQKIRHELSCYPEDRIAILVRTRNQLTRIMRLLRQFEIPFQGIEVDPLASLPHLRDVWSLTKALLMPANRLSWLALLRSPYAGLPIADLHAIANYDKKKSIYFALQNLDAIRGLSDDGRLRANYVFFIMHQALAERHQEPLVSWIRKTVNQLHGEHIHSENELEDLEQFWCLLEEFEQDGQIADIHLFDAEFKNLYAKQTTPSNLQVMTIHKAKGLEFDSVFLPGLSAKPNNPDRPLLRWLKLPTEDKELLLVSPIKAFDTEQCLLYDYLGRLDMQKDDYEQRRLLYVAATRAKKRLHLFDNREKGAKGTFRSFLGHQEFLTPKQLENPIDKEPTLPELYALPGNYYQQAFTPNPQPNSRFLLPAEDSNHRLLGIVTHELLQWICDSHPDFHSIPWQMAANRLLTLGFSRTQLATVLAELKQQIRRLFDDPIGQWLIAEHKEERNEFELLLDANGTVSTRIIDRTFVEQGIRWVIDFKTGRDDVNSRKNHQNQVNEYAEILYRLKPGPICCGIYYLASSQWLHWSYPEDHLP